MWENGVKRKGMWKGAEFGYAVSIIFAWRQGCLVQN